MKNFFLSLFAALSLFATSCSKSDDAPSTPAIATATVEGKSYTFSDLSWMDITFNGVLTYSVSSDDEKDGGNLFNLNLSDKKTGTIAMDSKNGVKITIKGVVYSSVSGTINVSSFNEDLAGTFTGKFSKTGDSKVYDLSGSFVAKMIKL